MCLITLRAVALLILLPACSWAQINFRRVAWKDVLAEAKAQRKLIFIDVYTDWCGPCKMLDRQVFTNKAVGKQFNGYFINYKADAEKGGMGLARTYNVRAYPTGLFIDGNGNLVHSFVGYRPAELLSHEGEQALLKTPDGMTLNLYANAYEQGDRRPELVRALLKLRTRYGQETAPVVEDYLTKLPADSLNKPINMLIAYENAAGLDRAFEVLVANKHDDRFRDRARVVLSQTMNRLIAGRDEAQLPAFMAAVDRLEGEQAGEYKAEYQTQYYQGVKQWDRYAEQADAFARQYLLPKLTAAHQQQQPDDFQAAYDKLCTIGAYFVSEVKDEARLKTVTDYVRQANERAETHTATGVCACLLYQLGQKEQALQLQEKALSLAEKSGSDVDPYKATLKRMQRGKAL